MPESQKDRPDKTIFVITTDGMENASSRDSYDKVQKMVKRQQKVKDMEECLNKSSWEAPIVMDYLSRGNKKNRGEN